MGGRHIVQPRDHNAAATTGLVKAARLFSNIVSPPVMFALLGFALAWKELPFWPGLGWATFYGLLVSLAPILLVVYLLRTGRISDLHMSQPGERRLPYLAAVAATVIALMVMALFEGPDLIRCLTLFSLIELGTLGVITNTWLISIHAASATAAALIIGLVFGPLAGIVLAPLVVLVWIVRLYLRRHNPAQVAAGVVLGIVVVMGLFAVGCFTV